MSYTWLITILALVGTIANVHKQRWCFVVWLITNMAWAIHNYKIGEYAQSALFATYWLLAVWGLRIWKKEREVVTDL
jgi:nicotinamide riboside transporter PnuC